MKKYGKIFAAALFSSLLLAGCSSEGEEAFSKTGFVKPGQNPGSNPSGGENELPELPPAVEKVKSIVLDASDLSKGTFKENLSANDDFKILATSEKPIAVSSKTINVNEYSFTKYIDLKGSALNASGEVAISDITYRAIKFEVKKGDVLTVVAFASGDGRSLVLANSEEEVSRQTVTKSAALYTYDIPEDGEYMLFSANSGISVVLVTNGTLADIYGTDTDDGTAGSGSSSGSTSGSGSDSGTSGTTTPSAPSVPSAPSLNDPTNTPEYANGAKIGTRTRINEIDTNALSGKIVVSTSEEFEAALETVKPGCAIVLNSGVYKYAHQFTIAVGNDGTESARKYIMPATGASVILDFSSQVYNKDTSTNARGLQINGNWWHIYGITVYGAADNGIFVAGKHNIIERCVLQANRDTGLQISRRGSSVSNFEDWPSDNLILNCTSFDNNDPASGENADGFASKLTCGEGNVFDGCIAYANSDDGWDLYAKTATGSIGKVTIKNCVAFRNGKTTTSVSYANGDMNGFKLGGSNGAVPTAHTVYNCLSFENGKDGFTDNGNGGALSVTACTAFANAETNLNFYRTNGGSFYKLISAKANASKVDKFGLKGGVACAVEKSVVFSDKKNYYYINEAQSMFNGDKKGTPIGSSGISNSEFISTAAPAVDSTVDAKCRNPDGTINMGGYLELASTASYAGLGARFGSEAYEILEVQLH